MSSFFLTNDLMIKVADKLISSQIKGVKFRKMIWKVSQISLNSEAASFIETALRHVCSPVNLLHIFRIPFPKNTSGWLLLWIERLTSSTAIFIRILQLNHFHKRHYLLFCTVYISILLCQRDLKCRYWVGLRKKIGWLP